MKKILTLLTIVLAFALNAQVTGVTLPNIKSGSIQIDTTGYNLSSWILYKVDANQIVETVSINELLMDSLEVGNYWILGQPIGNSQPYTFDMKYTIGVVPTNPCPTSNNIFIGTVYDVNTNTDLFCGQNNQGYQMQWYYDSIQMGSMPIQNCNSAIQMMNNGVLTLVGYGNTCNEYFTLGLGNNANYPPMPVGGGGGTSYLNELSNDLIVYPNPFNESITLNLVSGRITIYTILGEAIYQSEAVDKINTSNFKRGNYILEVTGDKNFRKMIVK